MNNSRNTMESLFSSMPEYNLNDYTVVVFGAGNTSALYQKCFELEGIYPVCYIDNNEAKHGTVFHGAPVISVDELVSKQHTFDKPALVLICSAQISICRQIQVQLQECELAYAVVDAIVFNKNKESIIKVYELLEDDFSKDTYAEIVQARMNNSPVPESILSNDQYFLPPQFSDRSGNEVFVDIGAYVGDTVEEYLRQTLGVFEKIYAFEPDVNNFLALSHRAERLKKEWGFSDEKLIIVQGGVGAKTESKAFSTPSDLENQQSVTTRLEASFAANTTEGADEVIIHALDDYFREQRVSFIKADIESYELDMLRGAESVIKRDRPLLAVCLYHNASDMFTIPLFVKELYKGYKLKIRHYRYGFLETVLYAYVSDGDTVNGCNYV